MAQSISEQLIYSVEECELGTPSDNTIDTTHSTPQPPSRQGPLGQGSKPPTTYEEYQQQWATVEEEERRDGAKLTGGDGGERISRRRKRYKVGS